MSARRKPNRAVNFVLLMWAHRHALMAMSLMWFLALWLVTFPATSHEARSTAEPRTAVQPAIAQEHGFQPWQKGLPVGARSDS